MFEAIWVRKGAQYMSASGLTCASTVRFHKVWF